MLSKAIRFSVYLIAVSLPLYLVRFTVWQIPFTLLEVLIYFSFIVWLIYLTFNKKIKETDFLQNNKHILYPVLLIFIGVTLSALFSTDLRTSAGIWKGWFIAPLMVLLLVINNIQSKEHIRDIIIALTASGLIVALISLYYWFNHQLTYDGRLQAFYLSPNYLAMYLSPILVLSFYLLFIVKNKIHKILLVIGCALLVAVIYLTYSYGAWLGLIGGLAIYLFFCKKRNIIYFLIILTFVLFCLQIPTQKFQNLLNFSSSPLKSRLIIWRSALETIKDHPVIGIGPGLFQKYYLDYQSKFKPYIDLAVPQPHNIFLAFWLQTGLLGLIGFIWLIGGFFKQNMNVIARSDACLSARQAAIPREKAIFAIIAITVMSYIIIHGLTDTTYWKNDLAVIFWLVIGLSYTASRLFYSQK